MRNDDSCPLIAEAQDLIQRAICLVGKPQGVNRQGRVILDASSYEVLGVAVHSLMRAMEERVRTQKKKA